MSLILDIDGYVTVTAWPSSEQIPLLKGLAANAKLSKTSKYTVICYTKCLMLFSTNNSCHDVQCVSLALFNVSVHFGTLLKQMLFSLVLVLTNISLSLRAIFVIWIMILV